MAYVITSVINSCQNILTNCLPRILALTEFGLSKASDYHCSLVGEPFLKPIRLHYRVVQLSDKGQPDWPARAPNEQSCGLWKSLFKTVYNVQAVKPWTFAV
jgi:hypothetical protein